MIFSDEIDGLLSDDPPYALLPDTAPPANVDLMVQESRRRHPELMVTSVFIDDDEPQVKVSMAPSWAAVLADPGIYHVMKFDARSGELIAESGVPGRQKFSLMVALRRLHVDLFTGLPGELFLGVMGLLFVVAILSGAVLYGPYMKKLEFGTVREGHTRRLKWLDLHNLLGIVIGFWMLVVGTTGVMNELSTPLVALWQRGDVKELLVSFNGRPAPQTQQWVSLQSALDTVRAAAPDKTVTGVAFPGSPFGTPYHFTVWTTGRTHLTSRLFSPILVDAQSGQLTNMISMPWYLRALEVSRPLHFGDYGGLLFKVIWALLDLLTILVLGSGVYLWIARRRSRRARLMRASATANLSPRNCI